MAKTKKFSHHPWVYLLLSTVITIALLIWAIRNVSWTLVFQAFQAAKPGWLCLGLFTFLASYVVRTQRWGTLLGANRNPGPFGIRQAAIFIGFGCNCILPGRVGEVVRAVVLKRFSEVPLGAAIGSLFTERLLDAAIAFILLLSPLLFTTKSDRTELATLPIAGIALVLTLVSVSFFVAARWSEKIAKIVGRISRMIGLGHWTPRILTAIQGLLSGLDALRYPGRCLIAIIQTFFIWGLMGISFWTVMIAFGIVSPGYLGSLFVQSVVALAIALPSSPGYLGPFEAGIRFGLELYQVAPETIVAYAITLHFLMNASLTVMGLFYAVRLGLSWKDFIPSKSVY